MLLDTRNISQIIDDLNNKKVRKPVSVWKKTAASICRKLGFLTVSILLRWPIWLFLGALCFFGIKVFDYLFLVYPGTEKDLDGYCPRWLAKSWIFRGKPVIGGIITSGIGGRGLTLVIPNTINEIKSNKDTSKKIVRRLNWIKRLVGAKSIALAGQMPGIIIRAGQDLVEPFVRGNKGTVFCVTETIKSALKKHNLILKQLNVVVCGVGYVGGVLMSFLEEEGYNVTGIDIKARRRGVKLLNEAHGILMKADLVVVLTPKGSDFASYMDFVKPGAIIIDDTHPKIHRKSNGHSFYKVAVGMEGVKFFPRLPGYKSDWIPGCAVEAITSAATGDFNGVSQEVFNKQARDLGFYAHLVN